LVGTWDAPVRSCWIGEEKPVDDVLAVLVAGELTVVDELVGAVEVGLAVCVSLASGGAAGAGSLGAMLVVVSAAVVLVSAFAFGKGRI
jgi:hypothetical protein